MSTTVYYFQSASPAPRTARRTRRLAWALWTGVIFSPAVASASIWESTDWAAIGILQGKTGYDSNLTLSNSGPEDFFVQASPRVTVLRRNSTTNLRFNGILTATEYLQGRQSTQTDVTLNALYAYPQAPNVVPTYRAEALWQKGSEPNQYLGRRINYTQAVASGEGYVPLTGKLGLRGEADFKSHRYENALNHNTRGQGLLGLAYKRSPLTELSLNIGVASGRSTPRRGGESVRSEEHYLIARIRGEITPKITGSVKAGYGQVSYEGGYVNEYNLPVVGADLTWGIDPRRTVVLAAYSGADYTPDGQSVNTTRAFLSFTHVIINRWQYTLRGGPSYSEFSREFRQRTDRSWDYGAEFAYRPSERFNISAGLSYTDQDSDIRFNKFTRVVLSLGSAYRF